MAIEFDTLEIGKSYNRPFLAKLWGYQSYHAISKGVVTPANTNHIILFVTKEKQSVFPQYNDYIDGNLLFWEGEEKHSSDQRIVQAKGMNEEIHLFYREIHHTPFVYFGKISLSDFQLRENNPSEFIFRIEELSSEIDILKEVQEHSAEYKTLDKTEREQIIASRLGQGKFRKEVIRLWGSCSITGLQNISLLRASHIKPWKDSNNQERLNPFNGLLLTPNFDFLFDSGYITFSENGKVILSNKLSSSARKILNVNDNLRLRQIFPENKDYLKFHNQAIFMDG